MSIMKLNTKLAPYFLQWKQQENRQNSFYRKEVADDEEECNDNGDDNCNEENQIIHQENNCKIVNEVENDDGSDNNSNGDNGNGNITCWTIAQNPESGDAILDEDVFDSIG